MINLRLNPLYSFLNALRFGLAGRIHFPRGRIGGTLTLDDGEWTIFREVYIDPAQGRPETPGAIFRPRFHVAGMTLEQNIRFSRLPIPFFIGLPGFRSKLWLYDPKSGDFSGYYHWDSVQDAENYARSFASRFMQRRSEPGSVSFRVIPVEE